MKLSEPKKPESKLFRHFFGSFYKLPADFRYSLTLDGVQAIEELLYPLFKHKDIAVSLSENRIKVSGNKAMEWSQFTVFIDHNLKTRSISYDGSYSIVWERIDSGNWVISKIIDNSFNI